MAYPTGMLSFVLEQIDARILGIKKSVQILRTDLAAGNVQSGRILSLHQFLRTERAALLVAAGTSGIAAYAQAQKNAPGLDVVAEFNGVVAQIDQVTTWIAANFPTDPGTGSLLERTLGADGPIERTFTPAQTAGLRTVLDGLIATIN